VRTRVAAGGSAYYRRVDLDVSKFAHVSEY
jgi:hypothetical protein